MRIIVKCPRRLLVRKFHHNVNQFYATVPSNCWEYHKYDEKKKREAIFNDSCSAYLQDFGEIDKRQKTHRRKICSWHIFGFSCVSQLKTKLYIIKTNLIYKLRKEAHEWCTEIVTKIGLVFECLIKSRRYYIRL